MANSHDLPVRRGVYNCVLCLDMLEHDDDPFQTMREIHRVLKVGGKAIIAVPGIGFPKHDYPSDYWRFTAEGLRVLLKQFGRVEIQESKQEVMAIAFKE